MSVVTGDKNKNKNVSDISGKEKSPPLSDHDSDSNISVSDDDDDIFGRDKKWVYKMRKGTPYPKVLKAVSPDYNDPEAVRDMLHKFRRALTRASNYADNYSDRLEDANALIKEKDKIILEERGKTRENVSQLIKAFSKKLDTWG